ncbi:Pribosyltran domain-containing protein [Cephalotus follicularis]|uniref:adenine phosphoribosyltransferase n=1 Tax=Cephalotus follicularis TaxID=3775 RepID=A0A1Q3AR90_CEPFO|nr:Pribosyltran domain-containing protein [Cephalotus follicularis]
MQNASLESVFYSQKNHISPPFLSPSSSDSLFSPSPERHRVSVATNSGKRSPLNRFNNYQPALHPLRCTVELKQQMATEEAAQIQDPRIAGISSSIRVIPDFPKPGIMFQDITTLLLDPKAFKDTIDLFVERYKGKDISVVAGIEARGFIFGPPIALAIGAKFVPMRKPNKLPETQKFPYKLVSCKEGNVIRVYIASREVISEKYSLEYGTDIMEMHVGAVQPGERALVVDDLIATGGTLCAAIKLLERVGVHVVESACVIELKELKGRERLVDKSLFVLISST